MKSDFENAVERIVQVVMFENWLRFYFISEEEDTLLIRVPEKGMFMLQKHYPTFYGLAEGLNNREITHAASLNEVCLFVASEVSGNALPEALVSRVFDSPAFQIELQLFSSWVQNHESLLDERFMEFKEWLAQYDLWRKSDEVQACRKRMEEQVPLATSAPSTVSQ